MERRKTLSRRARAHSWEGQLKRSAERRHCITTVEIKIKVHMRKPNYLAYSQFLKIERKHYKSGPLPMEVYKLIIFNCAINNVKLDVYHTWSYNFYIEIRHGLRLDLCSDKQFLSSVSVSEVLFQLRSLANARSIPLVVTTLRGCHCPSGALHYMRLRWTGNRFLFPFPVMGNERIQKRNFLYTHH